MDIVQEKGIEKLQDDVEIVEKVKETDKEIIGVKMTGLSKQGGLNKMGNTWKENNQKRVE